MFRLIASCARCAHNTDDSDTVCAVCRYPCSSRVCSCSYMHRECADAFLRHYSQCPVCTKSLRWSWLLQQMPCETEEDRLCQAKQNSIRHRDIRKMRRHIRTWRVVLWPAIMAVFKYRRPRNAHATLIAFALSEYEAALKQRLFDAGCRQTEVDSYLREIHHIASNFDTLPISIAQEVRLGFSISRKYILPDDVFADATHLIRPLQEDNE